MLSPYYGSEKQEGTSVLIQEHTPWKKTSESEANRVFEEEVMK